MKRHQTLRFRYGADLPVSPLCLVIYAGIAMPVTVLKLPAVLEEFLASQVRKGVYRSRKAAIVAAVLHQ
jgi:hypothetical protein